MTVITGGAGGMGTATAAVVGRDHAVVLADVRAERLDAAVAVELMLNAVARYLAS